MKKSEHNIKIKLYDKEFFFAIIFTITILIGYRYHSSLPEQMDVWIDANLHLIVIIMIFSCIYLTIRIFTEPI